MADHKRQEAQGHGQDMQLAQILSDLVSLRAGVCDPAAALALVSARSDQPPPSSSTTTTTTSPAPLSQTDHDEQQTDPDLRRARDLVHLHYTVRQRCQTGELGRGLAEARRAVEGVIG